MTGHIVDDGGSSGFHLQRAGFGGVQCGFAHSPFAFGLVLEIPIREVLAIERTTRLYSQSSEGGKKSERKEAEIHCARSLGGEPGQGEYFFRVPIFRMFGIVARKNPAPAG